MADMVTSVTIGLKINVPLRPKSNTFDRVEPSLTITIENPEGVTNREILAHQTWLREILSQEVSRLRGNSHPDDESLL